MARFTYTVSSCPHCGKQLDNSAWKQLGFVFLILGTMFTAFCWIIGIVIINKIFDYEKFNIGKPYYNCPYCGNKIKSENIEWIELNKQYKKVWTFRHLIKWCYALSGVVLFGLVVPLISGMWSTEQDVAQVFLIISIICAAIIAYIYYRWKNYRETKIYVVTDNDYDTIKNSWIRSTKLNPKLTESDSIKIWGTDRTIKFKNNLNQDDSEQEDGYLDDDDFEEDDSPSVEDSLKQDKLNAAESLMQKGIITFEQYSKIKRQIETDNNEDLEEDEDVDEDEFDEEELDEDDDYNCEEDSEFDLYDEEFIASLTVEQRNELLKIKAAEDLMKKGIITYSHYCKLKQQIESELKIEIVNHNKQSEELQEDCESDDLNDFEDDEAEDDDYSDNIDDDYDLDDIAKPIDNKNKKHIIVIKKIK